MPNNPSTSPVNISDVVAKLDNIKSIGSIDVFNAQKPTLVQAVQDLKTHLTFQDTQINNLTKTVTDNQAAITSLQNQNDNLKLQVSTQQATIDKLKAQLAAAAAAPPSASPLDLADSFRKVVDQIQTQARLQAASGPATTIRSMDIEVRGLVNVQNGSTSLVLPSIATPIDPAQLSTLRLSFAAVPPAGRTSPPAVTGISPPSGFAPGGTSVTITGSGFTGVGAVNFGSAPAASFSLVNDTQITAVSPPGTATVDVVVVTASGGASNTNPSDQFTYIPPPAVTGVSPNLGPAAGGTTVTITGTHFSGATAVTFGPNAATSLKPGGDTQVSAVSPAGTGTVDVVVTTPSGSSTISQADRFTYTRTPPPPPAIAPGGKPGPTPPPSLTNERRRQVKRKT